MVWDDKYLIGIEKIDEQHKMLFLITDHLKTAAHTIPGIPWLKDNLQKNNELLKSKLMEINTFISEKKSCSIHL